MHEVPVEPVHITGVGRDALFDLVKKREIQLRPRALDSFYAVWVRNCAKWALENNRECL